MDPKAFYRQNYRADYQVLHSADDQIALHITTTFEAINTTDEPQEYYTKYQADAEERPEQMEMVLHLMGAEHRKIGPLTLSAKRPEVWEFQSDIVTVPPKAWVKVVSAYTTLKPEPKPGKPFCDAPSFGSPIHRVEITAKWPADLEFVVDPVIEPTEKGIGQWVFDRDFVPNEHIPIRICVKDA